MNVIKIKNEYFFSTIFFLVVLFDLTEESFPKRLMMVKRQQIAYPWVEKKGASIYPVPLRKE